VTLFETKKRDAAARQRAEVETDRIRRGRRRFKAINRISGIDAASFSRSGSWSGIQTHQGDDALSRAYAEDLDGVISRAQDLDVNQADLHGLHRTRNAKVLGRGISFKLEPHPDEVGMDATELQVLCRKIDRIREIHSAQGGFDAQGLGRSEGMQMQRAQLSCFVHGACLIHRVWRRDSRYSLPLSLELIPANRISTPYRRQGDPKISYGIEYTDNLRTKVVGFHIRRVSMTIGDSFVPNFEWDFIPIEDASLLSLVEVAGIDRSLPLSTSVVRLLRNRGEFIDAVVGGARAQAQHYAKRKLAPGDDPYAAAADDATSSYSDGQSPYPEQFVNINGVQTMFLASGEDMEFLSAQLPNPDFKGFSDIVDSRAARGLCSSLSQFTRTVGNSFAGGRLEDQQDDPIVDQYRAAMESAWGKVNQWILEAIWLTGVEELPGYSAKNAAYWCQFRAQYYGKVHINPTDTMTAREKAYGTRSMSPQMGCEQDGVDFQRVGRQWAEATKYYRGLEKEFGLKEGELDFLLSGRAITTTGGNVVAPPAPDVSNPDPNDPSKPGMDSSRQAMLNRMANGDYSLEGAHG
jgi:capsid protein